MFIYALGCQVSTILVPCVGLLSCVQTLCHHCFTVQLPRQTIDCFSVDQNCCEWMAVL